MEEKNRCPIDSPSLEGEGAEGEVMSDEQDDDPDSYRECDATMTIVAQQLEIK